MLYSTPIPGQNKNTGLRMLRVTPFMIRTVKYVPQLPVQGSTSRAVVRNNSVTLNRKIRVQPFAEYVSGSGLSGMNGCESQSNHEGCSQIRFGKDAEADNYYHFGCCIKEATFTVTLPTLPAPSHAAPLWIVSIHETCLMFNDC